MLLHSVNTGLILNRQVACPLKAKEDELLQQTFAIRWS